MGILLRFPGHATSKRSRRSEIIASVSAVRPASLARGRAKTAFHHSDGMRSRCRHLLTEFEGWPTSAASSSRDGHRSMIDRNEVSSDIGDGIGPIVLNCKAHKTYDLGIVAGQTVLMEPDKVFIANTRRVRRARKLTQEQIGTLLHMPQDTYKQYERRNPLPHRYVKRFCIACGVEPNDLYDEKAAIALPPPKRRRRRKRAQAA